MYSSSSSSSIVNISSGESNFKRCAACKYLRRRCAEDCILSPYFPASLPHRFSCVHRVFGASNVARMLQFLPENERAHAADAIALEAYWRSEDPVYGSVGIINQLQHEITINQRELARTQAQIAIYGAAPQLLVEPFQLQAAVPIPGQEFRRGEASAMPPQRASLYLGQQATTQHRASTDHEVTNLQELNADADHAMEERTSSGFNQFSDFY